MKIIRKLAILILVIITTTPQIIQTYKAIYKILIKNNESIITIIKGTIKANNTIKTNIIDYTNKKTPTNEMIEKIKRQRTQVQRRYNLREKIGGKKNNG